MAFPNNNPSQLSKGEQEAVLRLAIGCTALVDALARDVVDSASEEMTMSLGEHLNKKTLTYSTAFRLLTSSSADPSTGKQLFRPADIRDALPDSVKPVQAADRSRALNWLERLGVAQHVSSERRWKSPSDKKNKEESTPGKISEYAADAKVINLKLYVTVPEVAEALIPSLIDSGVLRQYLALAKLLEYNLWRQGRVADAAALAQACTGNVLPESAIGAYFEKMKANSDNAFKVAEEWADAIIAQHKQDYTFPMFTYFLFRGGLYYAAPSRLRKSQPVMPDGQDRTA